MSFYVYILESLKTGRYYVGQTEDLEKRLSRHNSSVNKATKSGVPWNLKWWKAFDTRSESVREEKVLKALKKRRAIENHVERNSYRGVAQSG